MSAVVIQCYLPMLLIVIVIAPADPTSMGFILLDKIYAWRLMAIISVAAIG